MKSKTIKLDVGVEYIAIRDKQRKITAPQHDVFHVSIFAVRPTGTVILRAFNYSKETEAKDHYNNLLLTLGITE